MLETPGDLVDDRRDLLMDAADHVAMGDQAEDQTQPVRDHQQGADGETHPMLEPLRVGGEMMKQRGDDQTYRGQDHQSRAHPGGRPVELLDPELEPAREQARAQDEQQVADDAARQRRLDHVVEPSLKREESEDQLGGVAERGVEQAPDPGPKPMSKLLGRLSHQSCQGDDRQSGREKADNRRSAQQGSKDRDGDGDEQIAHPPQRSRVVPG